MASQSPPPPPPPHQLSLCPRPQFPLLLQSSQPKPSTSIQHRASSKSLQVSREVNKSSHASHVNPVFFFIALASPQAKLGYLPWCYYARRPFYAMPPHDVVNTEILLALLSFISFISSLLPLSIKVVHWNLQDLRNAVAPPPIPSLLLRHPIRYLFTGLLLVHQSFNRFPICIYLPLEVEPLRACPTAATTCFCHSPGQSLAISGSI